MIGTIGKWATCEVLIVNSLYMCVYQQSDWEAFVIALAMHTWQEPNRKLINPLENFIHNFHFQSSTPLANGLKST